MSPNPTHSSSGMVEGVTRAVGRKVANLRKEKSNHERENGATGDVWLLLHVEDFQDLSSEGR